MREQVSFSGGESDLALRVRRRAIVHDSLREAERLLSSVRPHATSTGARNIPDRVILLVDIVERETHRDGLSGLQHEVVSVPVRRHRLSDDWRLLEPLQIPGHRRRSEEAPGQLTEYASLEDRGEPGVVGSD